MMYWTDRLKYSQMEGLTCKPLEALLQRPNKFRGTLTYPWPGLLELEVTLGKYTVRLQVTEL